MWYNGGVGFSVTIEEGEMAGQTEHERFTEEAEALLDKLGTNRIDEQEQQRMIAKADVYAHLAIAAAISDVADTISEVADQMTAR